MDVFVARQPIFDKRLNTFGYELLFRDSMENFFPEIDGDTASSSVISNSFLLTGIHKLTGGKTAFINFTRPLLLKQIPCLFSPKVLFPELIETVEPDAELISAVTRMTRKGFRLVLDDFVYHEKYEPLIRIAEIIKIDIRQTPLEEARPLIERFSGRTTRFLAEKVETREEYNKALAMGFSYFQGYFFSRPEVIKQRSIAPLKIKLIQILGELNQRDVKIERIEALIKSDVSLSYHLLQYMNSAYFNLPRKVTSIRGAILFLGLNTIRKVITLLITARLAESKPNELFRASIIRAKMCELAGEATGYKGDISELFLLGLFSLMDAILDADMEQIVDQLPVSKELSQALVEGKGELADYLAVVANFEKGEWDAGSNLKNLAETMNLSIDKYSEAINWADSLTNFS